MTERVVISGYAYRSAISLAPDAIPATDPAALDLATQIPNRSDMRAQGPSQLLATYTAGLALDMAELKGDADMLARTDLMLATHFGERDVEIDGAVLEAMGADPSNGRLLNQQLSNLRPSLFLAQLQNLFAANISIVFGVLGTSITFMGETMAGARAIDEACSRILSGRSDVVLAGGVFNGTRPDVLEVHDARPPGADGDAERLTLGYGAGFVVLESARSAAARGAGVGVEMEEMVYTRFDGVSRPEPGDRDGAGPQWVYTDAAGSRAHVERTRRGLAELFPQARLRNLAGITGSLAEASFPFVAAVAADCIRRGWTLPAGGHGDTPEPTAGAAPHSILLCATGPGPDAALALVTRSQT